MKKYLTKLLITIVVLESIVIALLLRNVSHIKINLNENTVMTSPLELALEYEAPDAKFEELVKKYPSWIKHRVQLPDGTQSMPVLASCALLNMTNKVSILLLNGADPKAAISSLEEIGANQPIELIRHTLLNSTRQP
jgi:hypothetical protein